MMDNGPTPEPVEGETEDNSDLIYDFYVEKETSLIYEAKLFDGFALVRPADPWFHQAIRRVGFNEFCDHFDQYCGDSEAIRRSFIGTDETLTLE